MFKLWQKNHWINRRTSCLFINYPQTREGMCKEMKTHEEFVEEIKEANREPTLAERTHDALNITSEVKDGN